MTDCHIHDCHRQPHARGYCQLHYNRARLAGEFSEASCTVVGCTDAVKGLGFCNRHHNRHYRYGMTAEQMFEADYAGCTCCGAEATTIDHDHSTGRIRGYLCGNCNTMLGAAVDSPDVLRAGAEYLERHEIEQALERMLRPDDPEDGVLALVA